MKIHFFFYSYHFILLTCASRCYNWLAYSSIPKLCRNLERVTHAWLQVAESKVVCVRCQLLHNFFLTATSHNVTLHFTSRSVPVQRQWLTADLTDFNLHRRAGLCGNNIIVSLITRKSMYDCKAHTHHTPNLLKYNLPPLSFEINSYNMYWEHIENTL